MESEMPTYDVLIQEIYKDFAYLFLLKIFSGAMLYNDVTYLN